MSDDLTSALRGFADAQGGAAGSVAPDAALESGGLARRVRRRRAVRTGTGVLAATIVVGAVAAGMLLSGARTPAPPALLPVTPSPTTSQTPSPSPTPTETETPDAPQVATLRAAQPMAPGMLEATGDGWSLLRFEGWDEQEAVLAPATVYLLSPDGEAFVVPTASDPTGWYVQDWLPGTALALTVSVDDGVTRVLDLLTGDAGPTLGTWLDDATFVDDGSTDVLFSAGGSVHRLGDDGTVRWLTPAFESQYGSATWVRSTDGARIVLNDAAGPRAIATADLSALALPAPYPERPDACRAWMWVDDTDVLLECAAGGATAFFVGIESEFWLVPVDGGGPQRLVGMPDATRVGGAWRVDGRLVVGLFGPSEAEASWWAVTEAGVELLSTGGSTELSVVAVRGSELVAVRRPRSTPGGLATASVVAIDPVRGTTRTIVDADPARFASLVVAPDRLPAAPQTDVGD